MRRFLCHLLIAVLAVAQLPGAAVAQARPAGRTVTNQRFAVHVTDAAQRFGIPEAWIWSVIRVESNGDPHAVSSAGAMGLMQIMPGTWAALRARHGLGRDPYDVRDNIMAGAAYLRAMHDRYGNPTAMLAAYNAGPGRYDEYLSRRRPLPRETRAYVAKLAPITGGSSDIQFVGAPPPDPHAWRRAALFAARTSDIAAARAVSSDRTPDATGDASTVVAARQLDGLFVSLSGQSKP